MACYHVAAAAAGSWVVMLPWMAIIHQCSCSKHEGEHVPHCKLRKQRPEVRIGQRQAGGRETAMAAREGQRGWGRSGGGEEVGP